jgi:hypothetical protein
VRVLGLALCSVFGFGLGVGCAGTAPRPTVVLAPVEHGPGATAARGPAPTAGTPGPIAPLSPPPASSDQPLPAAFREAAAADLADAGIAESDELRSAVADEGAGDRPRARKEYYDIILRSPSSRAVPCAYVGFADMFFEEADAGSPEKWTFALQAYQKVVAFPPPGNVAYAYAWYRLGLVFAKTGDSAHAAEAQRRAMDACQQFPSLPLADRIAAAARAASP